MDGAHEGIFREGCGQVGQVLPLVFCVFISSRFHLIFDHKISTSSITVRKFQPEQTLLMVLFRGTFALHLLRPLAQKGSEEENPGDRLGCLCRRRPTGSLVKQAFLFDASQRFS